ncbi:MAG: SAV_915 family protein, partial [Sciscionella sp.]
TQTGAAGSQLAYVASQHVADMGDEAVLELRETDQGELAVLAFGSLDALVGGCGPQQPWICLPAERLDELVRRSGADGVLWEPALSEEQRHKPFGDGVIVQRIAHRLASAADHAFGLVGGLVHSASQVRDSHASFSSTEQRNADSFNRPH